MRTQRQVFPSSAVVSNPKRGLENKTSAFAIGEGSRRRQRGGAGAHIPSHGDVLYRFTCQAPMALPHECYHRLGTHEHTPCVAEEACPCSVKSHRLHMPSGGLLKEASSMGVVIPSTSNRMFEDDYTEFRTPPTAMHEYVSQDSVHY